MSKPVCGIAGFVVSTRNWSAEQLTNVAGAMADRLQHRGPDDEGTWCDPRDGVALGHRRLAILDLSEQGHQPMLSSCGSYVLIYNGEIYNHAELRQQLEQSGRKFRGHSDTEVLCQAISCWGFEATLPKLRGMFAFAVWNRLDKTLTLVRDRLGIKPLYYGKCGSSFLFGSELKSLRRHPEFEADIDHSAIALQLRHNYIPAPWSIYQKIKKLPAGCYLQLTIDNSDSSTDALPEPVRWWNFHNIIEKGRSEPFPGDYQEAVRELEKRLTESVRLRMLADVPVGAFLSGGIDSSLAVAIMQRQSNRAIRTFTIGFSEYHYDESPFARRIAEHLGTDHTELCVMPSETQNVIPQLQTMFDEPFSDMSQIPTYLVCKLARRDVTVALSGDGGDELFGGYRRYHDYAAIWNKLQRIPARQSFVGLIDWYCQHSPFTWKKNGLKRYREVLQLTSANQLYARLHRHWEPTEAMCIPADDPSQQLGFGGEIAGLDDPLLNWMALDTLTYLPEDILTKVDRTSMAVSLEARVPLLDHQVVELAWSLPSEYRFGNGQGKRILQTLLEKHVPRSLFERPKTGFGIPIGDWLRGSLFNWAEHLLSPAMLDRFGILDTAVVRKYWDAHQQGEADWQYHLWDVLMLQSWLEENQNHQPLDDG